MISVLKEQHCRAALLPERIRSKIRIGLAKPRVTGLATEASGMWPPGKGPRKQIAPIGERAIIKARTPKFLLLVMTICVDAVCWWVLCY